MTYLTDTSAAWRHFRKQIGEPRSRYAAQGLIALCPPVEAELMVLVRGEAYEPFLDLLRRTFGWCPAPVDPWCRALAVGPEPPINR